MADDCDEDVLDMVNWKVVSPPSFHNACDAKISIQSWVQAEIVGPHG